MPHASVLSRERGKREKKRRLDATKTMSVNEVDEHRSSTKCSMMMTTWDVAYFTKEKASRSIGVRRRARVRMK